MIWNEILCLGDSITYGARDEQGRSFPAELGKIMTRETGEFYYCHNHGVCGETSSDLLRRAWGAAKSGSNSKIATLMIGTNDTQVPTEDGVYEDNLRQIVSILKVHGMHVILCTLPELGITPLYFVHTEHINRYNNIIKKIAKEESLLVCEMRGTENFYIDGVHYTHEGYKELANRISSVILRREQ